MFLTGKSHEINELCTYLCSLPKSTEILKYPSKSWYKTWILDLLHMDQRGRDPENPLLKRPCLHSTLIALPCLSLTH